ncbi:MAG: methyltransferase domain-containing protein [Planctomycetales bacterium]|nr:methyltransferase domain-containing protein [Planctomycetales bacterium]
MSDTPPDPVLREYAELAQDYDRRWAFYVSATLRETLECVQFEGVASVLDVACGTGAVLAALQRQHPYLNLVGVDASAEMLSVARAKLGSAVDLRHAFAEQLPFPDGVFDLVVSANSFHYFQQPDRALSEMFRVLRPGGQLVITDWCDDYWTCRACSVWLRWTRHSHHRLYRSRECRDLLTSAGFQQVALRRFKVNWLWGLMTVIGHKPPFGPS